MRQCERRFISNNVNLSENVGGVWFESDCGREMQGVFNHTNHGECGHHSGRFCVFAGRETIRSAVQFEDQLKNCLAALCDDGISPQQFACILDKLADVERYLIEKIELGKDMAGC